jgi:hypothetical protein
VARTWVAVCRSWAAAAQHGEHAARHNGREPAVVVFGRGCSRAAGCGPGPRIAPGWAVQIRDPGLRPGGTGLLVASWPPRCRGQVLSGCLPDAGS